VIGGGDGTISSSSRQIGEAGAEMALLPLGTANSFARTVGLPLDVEGACRTALEGEAHLVDLGILGDHYFTNAAAIGLPAEIGRTVPDGLKRVFGRFAYALWAAWKLARFRGFTAILDDGSGPVRHQVVEVRIANGRFLGGLEAVPHADPEDHELVVQLVRGTGGRDLARAWAELAVGHAPEIGEVEEIRAQRLHIETEPPQPVSIDGEVLARTPTEIGLAPAALKLVMPRDQAALS
jgi:YegS/Rv2252/BmrU family lipid kinase